MAGSFGRAIKDRVLAAFGFKNAAYTNTIDLGGNEQPIDNKATWNYGFPSKTMLPVDTTNPSAGGIPPNGKDMNGVLNSISAECVNAMTGVLPNEWIPANTWKSVDSSWTGYPIGAIVVYPTGAISTEKKLYQSVASNNNDTPSTSDKWVEVMPRKSFLPDWGAVQTVNALPFTMPHDGWVNIILSGKYGTRVGLVSGGKTIQVAWAWARGTDYVGTMTNTFMCSKGDVIKIVSGNPESFTLDYCPFKK